MRVAGIQETGGEVKLIDVPDPRPLAEDEVLIQVKAAGVADWDEIVRTGGWDVGCSPPMALGVEAAGTVAAVGREVTDSAVGDEVITHPLPLRDQGTWAPELIAPATLLAPKPAGVSWEAAAVFPVPALTAEQVLGETLELKAGDRLSSCSGRSAERKYSRRQVLAVTNASQRLERVRPLTTTTSTGRNASSRSPNDRGYPLR
jgi:NADPH:quinone reductase-like Zn-dependent oxidoreductase